MAQRNTEDWFAAAACKGRDPHLFHAPDLGDEHTGIAWDPGPGIFVCLGEPCPVLAECEAYARDIDAREGVWAGIDFAKERHRSRTARLQRRERILALHARGKSSDAIAELLGCHPRTVQRHLSSV